MVDFGNRSRRRMQPSRSLPMSTLNQRERSTTTTTTTTPVIHQRANHRRVRRIPTNESVGTSSSHSGNASSVSVSPNITPNPYSQRETVKVSMTRRTPRRAHSHGNAAAALKVAENNRSRSSSPSKYNHHTSSNGDDDAKSLNPSNLICTSSPQDCLVNNNNSPRRRNGTNRFGIVKAVLRAISLVIMGFGGGILYNMYHNVTTLKTAAYHHSGLEGGSIPNNVLLNDELVKRLAQNNQLQEQEIELLKRQINEAKKQRADAASIPRKEEVTKEEGEPAPAKSKSQPQYVAIGKYNDKGEFQKYDQNNQRVISASTGNLRNPARRFIWDDEGHIQELSADTGESAAIFHHPHEDVEKAESRSHEDGAPKNVDQLQREEAYHQEEHLPSKDHQPPHKKQHESAEEVPNIWVDEHQRLREGPTKEQREAWDHHVEELNADQKIWDVNTKEERKNYNDPNWDKNSVMEELCIHHPKPDVERICQAAIHVTTCLKVGCKGAQQAKQYLELEQKQQQQQQHEQQLREQDWEQQAHMNQQQYNNHYEQMQQQQEQHDLLQQQEHDQNWDDQQQQHQSNSRDDRHPPGWGNRHNSNDINSRDDEPAKQHSDEDTRHPPGWRSNRRRSATHTSNDAANEPAADSHEQQLREQDWEQPQHGHNYDQQMEQQQEQQ